MSKLMLPVLTLFVATSVFAQSENNKLQFSSEGIFKTAQFTDLHWDNHSPDYKQTIQTIESVLAIEKPHLTS